MDPIKDKYIIYSIKEDIDNETIRVSYAEQKGIKYSYGLSPIFSHSLLCSVFTYDLPAHPRRNRLKIERTISLQENLFCICNITKDYILYIFTNRHDITLAIDAIKKANEYFYKTGTTATAKLQLVTKKPVQFMSIFEEFLYTRQITFRDFIHMKHPHTSKKKNVDDEIFNKFSHIDNESDKNTIFNAQIKSGQVEGLEGRKKIRTIQNGEKFQIKSQDDIFLLDVDPEKENYMNKYKRSIFKLAMGKKINKKTNKGSSHLQIQNSSSAMFSESREPSAIVKQGSMIKNNKKQVKIEEKKQDFFQQTHQQGESSVTEKMKLKIKQKLSLQLRNDKVKQVHQHGQIFVEGNQAHKASILLINQDMWKNPKVVSKRITPNSIPCHMISDTQYEITTSQGFKSKPIIDYVLRTETFSPQKIPLLFIYSMEVNSSNIEFTFKYKMNEKWKHKIFDLDITVYLNKQFVVLDCKSIPVAHSLKNNKVVWKTKQISPGASNSKGKILLAFGQAKFPPKQILSEVRLSMKSTCGLMEQMGVLCKQKDINHETIAQRMLLIEYKIHP